MQPRHPAPDPPGPDLGPLVELCHHRWAIPVLAHCAGEPGQGSKFVTMASTLGVSRPTLVSTLDALIGQSLLGRVTAPQHPIRPEYVLTKDGLAVAGACRAALKALRSLNAEGVGLNKWTLPVLAAIALQPGRAARFSQIEAMLADATARALASALRDAQAAGLVDREVLDTYPPGAQYAIDKGASRLAASVKRLVLELAHAAGPGASGTHTPSRFPGGMRKSA